MTQQKLDTTCLADQSVAPPGWRGLALLVGWLGYLLVRSLRIRVVGLEHFLHHRRRQQSVVFVAWHEHLALLAQQGGEYGLGVLVATGRDGDLGVALIKRLGMAAVQVDIRRRPLDALRALRGVLQQGGDVVLFADGPLGPARQARPGAAGLARVTASPLLPVAAAVNCCWRLPSWDRLRLPLPFARVVLVVGETLSADIDTTSLTASLSTLELRAREILLH